MAFPHMAAGGHFKAPAAGQTFNHTHAMQMGHAAGHRLAVAKALSGGGGGPPVRPGVPSMPLPGANAGGAIAPPPMGGNFKATIGHAMATKGIPVTVQHVHNAIHSLTQKGVFNPVQGKGLIAHNGPLVGPQGQKAMGAIANELATNPSTRMGM